jgi:DNA (cytosine-5)-methyltransferase 1
VISLFSAPGGLDLGFKKAGFKIVWANDIDADAALTYRRNLGSHILVGDIRAVDPREVPDGDIIIGGFPCLGFTIARGVHRRPEDPHNFLYLEFLRILKAKQTDFFLIENVPGMLKGDRFRELFQKMIRDFESAGYRVKYKELNAADYGVPQVRKRIIILGTRRDLDIELQYPEPTHAEVEKTSIDGRRLQKWVTLREAIGDLPLEPCTSGDRCPVPNHYGTRHKVKINEFLGNRPLDWDKPAPTILGRGSRTGGPVIHPHPNLHRRLTVRECARIQSFPDDFVFYGSPSAQYAQVGNAVPPLMAFRLAQAVLKSVGKPYPRFDPSEWRLPWSRRIPPV